MNYTEAQLDVLRRNAPEMFEVAFLDDAGLENSTCSCCYRKRAFFRRIKEELEAAKPEETP